MKPERSFQAFLHEMEHDLWRILGLMLALVATCTLVADRYWP